MQAGFRRALRIPPFLPNGGKRRTNRVKGMGVGIVTGVPEALLNGRLGNAEERRCLRLVLCPAQTENVNNFASTRRPAFLQQTHQRKIFIQQKLRNIRVPCRGTFCALTRRTAVCRIPGHISSGRCKAHTDIAGIGAVLSFLPVNPVNSLSRKMKGRTVGFYRAFRRKLCRNCTGSDSEAETDRIHFRLYSRNDLKYRPAGAALKHALKLIPERNRKF